MKLRPASPRNEILATLGRFRPALRSVALFTAVINLLMLAPSLYMLQVYDRVLGSGNHMTLLMLTLMVLGLYLLLGALEWVRSLVVIRLGGQLDMQLNQRIYDASFRASLERGEQAAGQALNDLTSLRQFLTGNALFAFFDAPWFPLYLLVIFLFSPWLGLLALAGALLLVLLAWVNESRSREPLAEAGQLSILATQQASANLRQAETLAAMGMLPAMRARWFAQHQAFLARQNLGSERSAAIGATSKGVRLALQSLVLGLGAWLAVEGLITPGMMIAGSILMGRVLSPIDQLIAVWRQWSGARQAYQRLARLLEENPPAALGMPLPAPRGALRVERLCAAAPGREQVLLQDLGFALEPGEALGVIGPSGSGKSTLARLLVGAWQPLSGAVRLDGADLRQWSAAALGPHIGYLAQDVQLFAGSIAENIARAGHPQAGGAGADRQAVVAAWRAPAAFRRDRRGACQRLAAGRCGPGAGTADAGVRFRLPAGTGHAGRRCAGRSGAMSGQARLREVGDGGAALELDEKRFSRLGWGLVLLGFVGFLLWAGLAPLDKGVGVSGTVMVAGSRKAVQHPTGGLVRHIRVHEGERVEAGQVLLEMDATQARAQADGLFAQYLAALASLARLSAERACANWPARATYRATACSTASACWPRSTARSPATSAASAVPAGRSSNCACAWPSGGRSSRKRCAPAWPTPRCAPRSCAIAWPARASTWPTARYGRRSPAWCSARKCSPRAA